LKKEIILSITLLLVFPNLERLNAQKMNFHIGYDINTVSRNLNFSYFGLKLYSNYLYYNNLNLRTNLSFNFHYVKNLPETPTMEDCFYTQIEESVIYAFDEKFLNIFTGAGIGYYSINTNGQSAHLAEIDPLKENSGYYGGEGFDSNFGFHFLIGKDLGPIILEIKYSYAIFPYHIKYLGTIETNYVDRIVSRKYAFHFLEISVSI
jgi:hypothetical protein